jgi:hypothetical protein
LRPLRGENSALAVGFGLELLLQPLPHPFAAFSQYFYLDFMQ